MFPHPQNLITVRAMEREQVLAEAARIRRHAPGFSARAKAPRLSFVRRAARVVAMLVG